MITCINKAQFPLLNTLINCFRLLLATHRLSLNSTSDINFDLPVAKNQ